jgi:hypothetical protein
MLIECPRIGDELTQGHGVETILLTNGSFLPTNEGRLGGEADLPSIKEKSIGILEHFVVFPSGHAGEEVELALFDFLDNSDGSFLIGEIIDGEFAGKTLTIMPQGGKQTVDIAGTGIDEHVHVLGEADVALQGDGKAADEDELHVSVSEQCQQFCERGFHHRRVASTGIAG